MLLETIESVLQGVSLSTATAATTGATTGASGAATGTTRLLTEKSAAVRLNIYQNMIRGTFSLATASIVEAVAGEEASSILAKQVHIQAKRFDATTTAATTTATTAATTAATISPNVATMLPSSTLKIPLDLRTVTWSSTLAPFEVPLTSTSTFTSSRRTLNNQKHVFFKSDIQTVHLSKMNTPNDVIPLTSNKVVITLEMKTTIDPRIQKCQTLNTSSNQWSHQGMITTGTYSSIVVYLLSYSEVLTCFLLCCSIRLVFSHQYNTRYSFHWSYSLCIFPFVRFCYCEFTDRTTRSECY